MQLVAVIDTGILGLRLPDSLSFLRESISFLSCVLYTVLPDGALESKGISTIISLSCTVYRTLSGIH